MKWFSLLLVALALAGCVRTRAQTEVCFGEKALAHEVPFRADAEALAWSDARAQRWAAPRGILAALEAEGRDPAYQAVLRRAVEGAWRLDADFLLERAMVYDHRAVGRVAVARGADPNRRVALRFRLNGSEEDEKGAIFGKPFLAMLPREVPLLLAVTENARAHHFLLDVGADPNDWPVGDLEGGLKPGIAVALRMNDAELVRHYVACGADITSYPIAGETSSPELAAWLVGQGTTLRGDAKRFSPLQMALMEGKTEVARVLLRHEPLEQPFPYLPKLNTLGLAAVKRSPLVAELLDAGARPDVSAEQRFHVALALAMGGDKERFTKYGLSANQIRPWDPEDEVPEGAAPQTVLYEVLREASQTSTAERRACAVRAANLLLDLGANPTAAVHPGRYTGRDAPPENTPIATWFASRVRTTDAPELLALCRRMGVEPAPARGRRRGARRTRAL